MDNHITQPSNGRTVATTAFKVRSTETKSAERNWSTAAASGIVTGNEDSTQNAFRITTDASRTSQNPNLVAASETHETSGLQTVFSSESQLNVTVMASTVAHDSLSVSETSLHASVFEESTAETLSPESSDFTVTVQSTSGTVNISSLETSSEDSQSHTVSTDPTITTDGEVTTNHSGAGWHANITGTLDSAEADTTTTEPSTGTSDAFTVSEVESPSQKGSDALLHANISEDATTLSSLGSRSEEGRFASSAITESHETSERPHTSSRTLSLIVEDTARAPSTTDTPRSSLSTSEATRTLHVNDTEPVRRTQLYSQADDQSSTASEVASEAPSGSVSSPEGKGSSNTSLIGIAVGATVAVVILVLVVIIILAIIYRRKRKRTGYITDHDLKDYRSLMKRPHEPMALVSPSVVQPISPFSDMFPQDVSSNGPPVSKYKMINFDKNSDDGLDGIEIVHDDSREQRSPKEIPTEEYDLTPSGYSDGSYSVNTFRPPERKNEQKGTGLTQSEAETKFNANESSGNDEKAIEE